MRLKLVQDFPQLKVKRCKHSQILVRDHFLVVLFGYRDENSFSDWAEWVDLRHPLGFK